ncbi:translation initiation factor eIF-2B epsilon subunit, GEF [Yamadazyma tenuis]|uniref:Translation initiation factor eIF2B subunit epsilon n=1 Tax=Candida tenuis (strain ATCC 10573 / BCRC 21748 / CBS 615 / JCM 9827 / NBRC 10315 / NRRL Y-1498 / VKM Y-70) TaxID=590646 RepID=G3B372_CANTC|nr:uncharacterized protein CANTEDRAFT_93606 [Yamadazyma tenuis ATCC 10573]EGV64095.1 hypothetical protein CANTEDRAFT_93606 [Yamadazyma tenuis ATCC 10573]WEJ96270.1 translation initiation factor eIF-2B epsilon subunit, GEF [Yamadazyma tenuis]
MAPKKKKELDQDERFQAIVLTDSFFSRFMPLTAVTPRCLLPLANVPLIEYTLEFLAKAGVNEVYVMCSSHADQIQKYIDSSKWTHSSSPFTITTVMSLEARSVGDTMRDLDNRGLITGDFLLVSGDTVTNIDFSAAMAFHRRKKQHDKEHILTMILTPASPYHRTRSQIDSAAFVLDRNTDRCIYYHSVPPPNLPQTSVGLDPDLLEDVDELILRNDLIDCHIDICTPLVPQIFQDNFDYQLLRSDFVKGVLTSDLVKKTVYAYLTNGEEYAARVTSFLTYDAVAQDVISRWCYPVVPEVNLMPSHSYSYQFNHIYKEDKVILAQSCKIGNCTAIGNGTEILDGSSVSRSTIGRNCKIGKNVSITDSYIWDGVEIADNCVIHKSILAYNVTVHSDAEIVGSVVGHHVTVGRGRRLAVNSRLVETPIERESAGLDSFSDDERDQEVSPSVAVVVNDIDVVGVDGVGHLYVSEFEENDSEDSDSEFENTGSTDKMGTKMYQSFKLLNISDDSIASVSNKKRRRKTRRFSSNSVMSTDFERGELSEEEEDFAKEAVDTVTRSIENNHDLDTALLELNTLRMSMNVSYHEVRAATVEALTRRIGHFISTGTLGSKEATVKVFKSWGPLFNRQLFEPKDQVDLLMLLQSTCASGGYGGGFDGQVVLFWAIRTLYDDDIVEEDRILQWWNSEESAASADIRGATVRFIEWLQEAEEESD